MKNGYIENKIASQLAIILVKDSERGPSSIKKRLQGTGEVITHWHRTDFLLLSKPEQSSEKLKQRKVVLLMRIKIIKCHAIKLLKIITHTIVDFYWDALY